ncbi:MAG TPA: RecX family transcriptional regulator [Bacillota bacterium]|nr:RecX family transcriptional regulator [Bacillota bacterium]
MYRVKNLVKKGKNYQLTIENNDQETTFNVSEDLLVEYRLLQGKVIEENQFKIIEKAINRDSYYQKVLKFALFKPRTKKEIFAYLDKLQVEEYGYYLTKLEKMKLLDDDSYTKNFVHEAVFFKRFGPRKIREELRLKGIKIELINESLTIYNEVQLQENINFWLEKKVKSLQNKPFYKTQKSLIDFCMGKGFEYEDISPLIGNFQSEAISKTNELNLLSKEASHLLDKYQKKDQKQSLNQFLITKLLAKGYRYDLIKKYLEGSQLSDE